MAEKVDKFITRILGDTGELCRDLLGYNYDEDEGGQHVNVGKGGIVPYGKTQECIELLDDRALHFKLIKLPREARKSTMAQGFCIRQILLNPNVRIAYIGRTDAVIRQKSIAVRAQLEREEIRALFGEMKGDKWEEAEWTVATRTNVGLQNATFTAFSMDSLPVGGRFDFVILDDFIDDTNVTTPEQNKKSKDKFGVIQPFVARGGYLIVIGTTWADDDLYADLEASPLFAPPLGGQLICGAGVKVAMTQEGRLTLEEDEGGLTFPHLTLPYLTQKLLGMSQKGQYDSFVRQYLNEATSRNSSYFYRHYFRELGWGQDMEMLSGFLLTDTAISKKDEACFSVVAYAGLDAFDTFYLLDLRIGRWSGSEFTDQFFEVLEKWQQRVNHVGECWEEVQLALAYQENMESESRRRKTKLNPITMSRGSQNHKKDRILRMEPPMRNNRFFVVDTVPRIFTDMDGDRELWNPHGFYNARTKRTEPSGELVDEFLKSTARKDIPDTLAMLLEYKKTKHGPKRYCQYRPYRPRQRQTMALTEQRKADYHRQEYQSQDGDWWERTLNEHGF